MKALKTKDITGQKFNQVTVLKRVENKKSGSKIRSHWLCRCDCGKEFETSRTVIVRPIKSCGHNLADDMRRKFWKGCGELSGAYWSSILKDANSRELEVSITIEDAWNQYIKQDGKCTLSGRQLSFHDRTNWRESKKLRKQTASLDRIDSSKGYVASNIQWIHKDFQPMKWTHSQQKFIELCNEVVTHQSSLQPPLC